MSRRVRIEMDIWTDQTTGQVATVIEDALREAGAGAVLMSLVSEVQR